MRAGARGPAAPGMPPTLLLPPGRASFAPATAVGPLGRTDEGFAANAQPPLQPHVAAAVANLGWMLPSLPSLLSPADQAVTPAVITESPALDSDVAASDARHISTAAAASSRGWRRLSVAAARVRSIDRERANAGSVVRVAHLRSASVGSAEVNIRVQQPPSLADNRSRHAMALRSRSAEAMDFE